MPAIIHKQQNTILITRKALREFQQLKEDLRKRVLQVLPTLGTHHPQERPLTGTYGLWRRRIGDHRIIWRWNCSKSDIAQIEILRVRARDKVYGNMNPLERENVNLVEVELTDEPEDQDRPEAYGDDLPRYHLPLEGLNEARWRDFLCGEYRYSPCLSDEQREFLEVIFAGPSPGQGKEERLGYYVESGPGTGKTVCAAHIAALISETHSTQGCYVALIVPENLREELLLYPAVKKAFDPPRDNTHFIGDIIAWYRNRLPGRNIPSRSTELEAYRKASGNPKATETDLAQYMAFVIGQSYERKDILAVDDQETHRLKKTNPVHYKDAFQGIVSDPLFRWQLREKISEMIAPRQARALIIVDEGQDLYSFDLITIEAMVRYWRNRGVETDWILLADRNQRIITTGFEPPHIKKLAHRRLRRNYRNSEPICRFANSLLQRLLNETASQRDKRHVKAENLANPEDCFAGDPVKILVLSNPESFLDIVSEVATSKEGPDHSERWLVHRIADETKVLGLESFRSRPGITLLNPFEAKGREFASCVLAGLQIRGETVRKAEMIHRWYTLITRAQSRLLVVLTPQEYGLLKEGMNDNLPTAFDASEAGNLASWIRAENSEARIQDVQEEDLKNKLRQGFERGLPYFDTYETMGAFTPEERSEIESRAIIDLKCHPEKILADLDRHEPCSRLRCLLLRALGRSWEAANQIDHYPDPGERYRLLEAIAIDLQTKRLPGEAANLRHYLIEKPNDPRPPSLGRYSIIADALLELRGKLQEALT